MKKTLILASLMASAIYANDVQSVPPAINSIPSVTFKGDVNAIVAGTDMNTHNELFALYGNLGVTKELATFNKLTLSGTLTLSSVGNFNFIKDKDLMSMIYQGGKHYTGLTEGYLRLKGPNGDVKVGRMILNEDLMGKNDWGSFLPTSFDGVLFTGYRNGVYSKLGYFNREQGYYTTSNNPTKSIKYDKGIVYSNIGYKNSVFDLGLSSVYKNDNENIFMQYASLDLSKWTNKDIKVSQQYLKYNDKSNLFDNNDVYGVKVECNKGNIYGALAYNHLDKLTKPMYSADPLFTSTTFGAAYLDRKVNAGTAKVGYIFKNIGFAKNNKADFTFASYKGDLRNAKVYEINAQSNIKGIGVKTSLGYIHNNTGKIRNLKVAKVVATYKF